MKIAFLASAAVAVTSATTKITFHGTSTQAKIEYDGTNILIPGYELASATAFEMAALERNLTAKIDALELHVEGQMDQGFLAMNARLDNIQLTPGQKGATGAQGTHVVGAKGQKGATGSGGSNGAKGAQGNDGSPGSNGAKGAQGNNGNPGSNGAKGEQGEQGEQGEAGLDGLSPVAPVVALSSLAEHYCLMINGLCWLWVSPCAGGCSQVPMPTAKPSWCPSGARYASQGEWNSAIGDINNQRANFYGKCSASIFDPTHNHCDSNDPFVRVKSYNYHELVLICANPV